MHGGKGCNGRLQQKTDFHEIMDQLFLSFIKLSPSGSSATPVEEAT